MSNILTKPRGDLPCAFIPGFAVRCTAALLLGWAGATGAQSVPASVAPPTDLEAKERVLPFEVTVNGSNSGTWLLLERRGVLYAPRNALQEWRILPNSTTPALDFRGVDYLPLSDIAGFNAQVNASDQSIALDFSPQSFTSTRLNTERDNKLVLSPVLPSMFFNYDLNYATTLPRSGRSVKDLGLLSEIGVSNGWGVLTSSQVSRLMSSDVSPGSPRAWLRLETTFTKNLQDSNRTLRLGDTSTRTGLWGRNIYFGGIQWTRNFGLTPGFISQPLPVLNGISSAPSTVELYVNDVLRQVSNVPAGPFAINNLPILSGGEARLVVRDLLGRETVITQPFFTSSQLLAKNLSDWSVEAGRLRLDLGLASGHYGQGFTSGTWRHGLMDNLTVEGRTELTAKNKVLGLGLVTGLPANTLGKAVLVASREQSQGSGHQWLLGLERQGLRSSVYLEAQGASINFRQLGLDASALPTKRQVAGNFSYYTEKAGTFGLGFASLNRFDAARIFTVSATYSMRLGERSYLSLTASHAMAGASGNFVGATLVVPLEKNQVLSASVTHHDGQRDFNVTASQHPGFDESLGWRTLAGRQQNESRAEGGVYYTGRYGRLSGDLGATTSQTALRLGATGGLVIADGHLFATQRVDDSFAVAEVAGYSDIGMGLGSNVLTRTNAAGIALIPRMMAYQSNAIRIDPTELPLSAEIDSIEQMAVPAWRSAVKVMFPVRSGRAALIKLVLDDGEPAPAGAVLHIDGDKQAFYVARRGEAFVTGLQPANQLRLSWNHQQCQFSVMLPAPSKEEFVRLAPLTCKGVTR